MSDTTKKDTATDIAVLEKKLTDSSKSLGAKLTASLAIDNKTGTLTETTPNTYLAFMPADLSKELAESFAAYNTDFAAGLGIAITNLSIPAMQANAELKRTTAKIPTVGKDSFGATFDRTRVTKIGDQPEKTTYGIVNLDLTFYGSKDRGQLAIVKDLAKARASVLAD